MARQVQFRRGTTAEHSTFTGAVGEITVDTDKDVVVIHDGATAGGFPLTRQLSDLGLTATELNYVDGVTSAIQTQLDAVTDPNHYTFGDILDLMIALYMGSSGTSPTSDGVSINYDAEALNQGAVLGTDYDYDFPDSSTVRITSNAAQNLKVRVV